MRSMPIADIEVALLTGYIAFIIGLNVVALLISIFNQKKFDQTSPKAGFLIGICAALVCIVSLFTPGMSEKAAKIVSSSLLLISSAASLLSITNLFFIMGKVRK